MVEAANTATKAEKAVKGAGKNPLLNTLEPTPSMK